MYLQRELSHRSRQDAQRMTTTVIPRLSQIYTLSAISAQWRSRSAHVIAMTILFASGCQTPQSGTASSPRAPVQRVETEKTVIGNSVEGRPIACDMYGRPGGQTVLMLASIHGTERAGTPLLRR